MSRTKRRQAGMTLSSMAIVVAIVAVLALAALLWLDEDTSAVLKEYRVEKRVVGVSILERGQLVSRAKTPIKPLSRGMIVELPETGTSIKKGQVVLRIDDTEPIEWTKYSETEIAKRQIEKSVQQRRYEAAKSEEEKKIAFNVKKFEHAKLELAVESEAMTDDQRRLLQIEAEINALDVADAREEHAHQTKLHEKDFISTSMLERFERSLETALAYQKELVVKAELKEKGIPVERRIELEMNVKRKQSDVQRGQKAMARRLSEIQHGLNVLDARIAQERFNMKKNKDYVNNSTVYATADGIMQRFDYRDWRAGGVWAEKRPGVRTYEYDTVGEIIDPSKMQIELMVNEADFHRLSKDTPVKIKMPAYQEREFTGKMIALGGVARDRSEVGKRGQEEGTTGVAMFNATVVIECDDVQFRPGMSALVEFIIEQAEKRLVVPRNAVQRNERETVVYRKSGGKVRAVSISGRVYNDEYFLVTEGLKEGDVIYLDYEKEGS